MSDIQNVLWTSGWDSTFRVLKLIEKGAVVQPIYVFHEKRTSRNKELETIKILSKEILDRYGSNGGKILDLITLNRKELKFNLIQKISYKILKRKRHLGKQYYWLSCLALKMKNLELSVHSKDFSFLKGKTIIITDENIGSYAILDPKVKDVFLKKIFGKMRFPIYNLTKLDMKLIAEKENFIDIMHKTWFCHASDVKPCKECTPCKQLVRDGMDYRLHE
ncbi:hypothetical protein [Tenacibaculum retecalamus]|uniref:hypothetical protein n=1 Tax=Tenacibaculum retecalamus TaxID=3018315 RepID=UPI0023D96E69|nr:hypothetical protein [Tenacibaculum retecalamus]WBX70088.1 hypothetical protein PG912_07230 [Tenacibaculum retecalamus]